MNGLRCGAVAAFVGLLGLVGCADVLDLGAYDRTTSSAGGSGGTTTSSGGTSTGGETSTGGGGTSTGGTSTGGGGANTGGTGGETTSSTLECAPNTQEPCYDGPPGTQGIGECKAGNRTCGADGVWGACDSIGPAVEDCATHDKDESCDNLAKCTGAFRWAQRYGDDQDQQPLSIATDSKGDVIVAGVAMGVLDFGDGAMPPPGAGGYDAFVAKLGPDGTLRWAKRWGDAGEQVLEGVAVDADDNVIVAGRAGGSFDVEGQTLTATGKRDLLLVKLAPDGSPLWRTLIGGPDDEMARAVAVTPNGDVLVSGWYDKAFDAGGGDLPLVGVGKGGFFLLKRDAAGAHLWSKGFSASAIGVGTNGDQMRILVHPPTGDIVTMGSFVGSIDFGGGALSGLGTSDVFAAAFHENGDPKWSHRYGSGVDDLPKSAAMDKDGSVVLMAQSSQLMDVGKSGLTAGGGIDAYTWRVDATGVTTWAIQPGDGGNQFGSGVAIDPAGNILLSYAFSGTITLGTPIASGSYAFGLVKLTAAGAPIWARQFPGADFAVPRLASDRLGNILFASILAASTDFGGGPLASKGQGDVLIASFAP